jgi:hypothetical protein
VIILGEDAPDHVLVDLDLEREGDLLCDSRTAEAGIATLDLQHCGDQFLGRPLGARAIPPPRRKEKVILQLREGSMASEHRADLYAHRDLRDALGVEQTRPEPKKQPIPRGELGARLRERFRISI